MTETDIGDFLEVPEDQRESVDPPPEYNADAGFDVQVVPDGIYVDLDTADPNERAYDDGEFDEAADGAPLQFVAAADPIHADVDGEDA